MDAIPPGYECWEFTDSRQIAYPILTTGNGPGVLVLHELAGLSADCLRLGKDLAAARMSAHLPAFYRAHKPANLSGALRLFCLRHEFTIWATGRTSPVASWIRDAAAKVHQRCGGPGVGVVGMCMTGGLALASLTRDDVVAAVASQPVLPLAVTSACPRNRRADLGLYPADVEQIRSRQPPPPILALRFARDWMCPPERLESIAATFPDAETVPIPGKGHSVLTKHLRREDPEDPTMLALQRVVTFLGSQLGVPSGN